MGALFFWAARVGRIGFYVLEGIRSGSLDRLASLLQHREVDAIRVIRQIG